MQLNRLIIRGPLCLRSSLEIHFVWNLASLVSGAGARFSKAPVIIINIDRGFNSFASYTIKPSVNGTKWSSLLARTRAAIFRPEKLQGLSRNGPLARFAHRQLELSVRIH